MSQWILDRTENPDLQAAARAIIAAQDPEITEMTGWLKRWYGRGVDEMAVKPTVMSAVATGDADTAFLREMTVHHRSVRDIAQLALTRDIIVAQAKEIYTFQKELKSANTANRTE